MDDRTAIVEGIASGVASYLAAVRTKPLTKAQISEAFGVSTDYVGELLKTIPGVRAIGQGRKRGIQYTLPLLEMPLDYQLECGFSRWFAVLRGFSRDERNPAQTEVGPSREDA